MLSDDSTPVSYKTTLFITYTFNRQKYVELKYDNYLLFYP
ncbi:hypothetical protein CSC17_5963 (plasmid) [Klebsiella oxytoca]|nr:hypothetical protein CSC17_5963 [Klebsiella oxytoca]